jgi:hypothetical protein
MPTIKVDAFGGIVPKLHPTLLPDGCATKAHNCVLKSGKLVPLRQPSKVAGLRIRMENGLEKIADAKTIMIWHRGEVDEMLAWPGLVDVAQSNIADDEYKRLFVTGETGVGTSGTEPCVYLATATGTGVIRYSMVKDVLPAPVMTPLPVDPSEQNKRYTVFFQSWVDAYGYESGASLPSEEVEYVDGDLVGIGAIPAPANAVKRRVYKVVAGTESESIQFVWEQPVIAGTFTGVNFKVLDEDAGEVMPNLVGIKPDLIGMKKVPGDFFVGFSKSNLREVRFSEVSIPCSWPDLYAYSVHDDIVGLGVTLNSVFVLTKGMPWAITGTAPESMTPTMLASQQGCVSVRSICTMDGAVFYASADGVCVLRDGVATVQVVTSGIFSKREWAALGPSSCVMEAYDGALHLWFLGKPSAGGYTINFNDGNAAVTTNDESAKAVCVDPVTDKLYFVRQVGA